MKTKLATKFIKETKTLIEEAAVLKRFDQITKFLKKSKVELDVLKVNMVRSFCEIEFLMLDMAKLLCEDRNYSSETENMKGSKRQEKNPVLPEYRGMIAEYKKYQATLELWIKEASTDIKPITKDENDEFSQLEQVIAKKKKNSD